VTLTFEITLYGFKSKQQTKHNGQVVFRLKVLVHSIYRCTHPTEYSMWTVKVVSKNDTISKNIYTDV